MKYTNRIKSCSQTSFWVFITYIFIPNIQVYINNGSFNCFFLCIFDLDDIFENSGDNQET